MKLPTLDLQKVLGYKINQNGMCYGIAFMAIQAILRNDFKTYRDRLDLIDSYYSKIKYIKEVDDISKAKDPKYEGLVIRTPYSFKIRVDNDIIEYNYENVADDPQKNIALYWLKHDIEKAQEKRCNKNTRNYLTYNDHQLLDILSWFDGVQVYYGLDTKSLDKDNKYRFGTQNYQKSIDFFKANDSSNIYLHSSNLTIFTLEVAKQLYRKIILSNTPIAFSLSNGRHIITIGGSKKEGVHLINHDYNVKLLPISYQLIYTDIYTNLYDKLPSNVNDEAIYISEFKNVQAQTYNAAYFSIDEKHTIFPQQQVNNLLSLALIEGHAEAVKAYIGSIKDIPMAPMINKEMLLAAKSSKGYPGLYMALQNGHAKTVKVYIEGVKNIPGINKDMLLAAKSSNGTPGLYMALQEGHAETVKVYVEGVKNIPGINKEMLLAAKCSNGTPGLCVALHQDHAETVKVYVEGVKNIPEVNKDNLLAAINSKGAPELSIVSLPDPLEIRRKECFIWFNDQINNIVKGPLEQSTIKDLAVLMKEIEQGKIIKHKWITFFLVNEKQYMWVSKLRDRFYVLLNALSNHDPLEFGKKTTFIWFNDQVNDIVKGPLEQSTIKDLAVLMKELEQDKIIKHKWITFFLVNEKQYMWVSKLRDKFYILLNSLSK
ncbi:hypothetical protein [Allofrancisella frigidaquae]|uniref:Uncharacterized protein n=1 Tax=Allofrancisella frigidaquae TaxID=1085644 RepID=A0A6M3HS25_9GAMM|nr:hypothetical protein [Allofrancisella frigidaquae]QIV93927.1 hypothetical protein E3E15_00560 [Allofrancisella frigidaquae]